jgi:hypothetical protein
VTPFPFYENDEEEILYRQAKRRAKMRAPKTYNPQTHRVMEHAEVERLYWVVANLATADEDICVEMKQGGHESIFDAIDACMEQQKSRRAATSGGPSR